MKLFYRFLAVIAVLFFVGCNGSDVSVKKESFSSTQHTSREVNKQQSQKVKENTLYKPFVNAGHAGEHIYYDVSEDNNYFVSVSDDSMLKIWSLKGVRLIRSIKCNDYGYFKSVKISKDYILAGNSRGVVYIYNIYDGKLVKKIKVYKNLAVMDIAISKDGNFFAVINRKSLKLFDFKNYTVVKQIDVQNRYFKKGVSFCSDSKSLAFIYNKNTIKVLNLADYSTKTLKDDKAASIESISFADTDRIFFITPQYTAKWDVKNHKIISKYKYGAEYFNVNLKNNEVLFVKGSKLHILAADTLKQKAKIRLKNIKSYSLRMLKRLSKHKVFIATRDSVNILNTQTKKQKSFKIAYDNPIVSLSMSNNFILATFADDGVSVFDIYNSKLIMKIPDTATVMHTKHLCITNDGSILAISKNIDDGKIVLWDIKNKKYLGSIEKKSSGSIERLGYSNDNKRLIIVSKTFVEEWDIKSRRILKKYPYTKDVLKNGYNLKYYTNRKSFLSQNYYKVPSYVREASTSQLLFATVTDKDKYIVSVSWDRKVNIFNPKTKKLLLSFVVFENDKFIAITPEGYFSSSNNASKYINLLTSPMDVVTIDQYYDMFYRPDIVKAALKGKSFSFNKFSDIGMAPYVEILNTDSVVNTDSLKLKLKIKQKSGGVGKVQLFLNSTAVQVDNLRALKRKASNSNYLLKTYTLKLLNGKNTIKVIVYNKDNTMSSNEALYEVYCKCKSAKKINLYGVVIGINSYRNPKLSLKYAKDDAVAFAKSIKKSTKKLVDKADIKLLVTKEQTSKQNIINTIKEIQNKIKPDDIFVFYVASHGTVDDGKYFLISSNVGSTSTRKLKKDALTQSELRDILINVPSSKKLIIFDTCNSGQMGEELQVSMLTRGMSEDTAMKLLSRAVGSTILSSANSYQEALEGYKGHGLFTYVLVDGLNGKADLNKDGFIKTRELADYVEDSVPEIAQKVYKREQFPVITPVGDAFPIGVVR